MFYQWSACPRRSCEIKYFYIPNSLSETPQFLFSFATVFVCQALLALLAPHWGKPSGAGRPRTFHLATITLDTHQRHVKIQIQLEIQIVRKNSSKKNTLQCVLSCGIICSFLTIFCTTAASPRTLSPFQILLSPAPAVAWPKLTWCYGSFLGKRHISPYILAFNLHLKTGWQICGTVEECLSIFIHF